MAYFTQHNYFEQVQLRAWHGSCAVLQDRVPERAWHLVKCCIVTVLKLLIIYEQGDPYAHFALSHKLRSWSRIRDSSTPWCISTIHSLLSSKYPIVQTCHNLFIHSPHNLLIHLYLDIWVVFPIINKASMNICWQVFV